MNIGPKAHVLRRFFTARHSWKATLSEVIDNALNAKATSVRISFGRLRGERPEFVLVEDNGRGADMRRMQAMVTPGDHVAQGGMDNGEYGIGAKDFVLWAGGEDSTVSIRSVHDGRRYDLDVTWRCVDDTWEIADPSEVPASDLPNGVQIRVAPVNRKLVRAQYEELQRELAYRYTPALRRGSQIALSHHGSKAPDLLTPYEHPKAAGEIVDQLVDVGGRQARVTARVVAEGEANPRPGITVWSKHRVVIDAGAFGCRDYGIRRISGSVELLSGWRLTPNKDSLDVASDELEAAVFSAIQPVLLRASSAQSELESSAFLRDVNVRLEGLLTGALANTAKGKRRRTGLKPGTIEPNEKPRTRHKNAKNKQPGSSMPDGAQSSSRSVKIEWLPFEDPRQLGRCRQGRIQLNENNVAVARARAGHDATVVIHQAMSVLAIEMAGGSNVVLLRSEFDGAFNEKALVLLGELLSAPSACDGESSRVAASMSGS